MELPERLYPVEFPELGDVIIAKITRIEDTYVYCDVLEYDCEGMIPLKEISRKKIWNIKQFVKVGSQEFLEVIDVDAEKGYIDLSKRRVTGDQSVVRNRYITARRLHTFFTRASQLVGENLVEPVLWPHYDSEADEVYSSIKGNTEWIDSLPVEHHNRLREDFRRIFERKAEKCEKRFEILSYDGVDDLQAAINSGLKHSTDLIDLHCHYTGKSGTVGNIFVLSTVTKEENVEEVMSAALESMRTSLATPHRFQLRD